MAESGSFQFDKRISLGNILTIFGMGIAAIAGYMSFQEAINSNTAEIAQLRKDYIKLAEVVETNREFHIGQRVRLWERVNEVQNASSSQAERLARIESSQEYLVRQIDKIVDKLENVRQ